MTQNYSCPWSESQPEVLSSGQGEIQPEACGEVGLDGKRPSPWALNEQRALGLECLLPPKNPEPQACGVESWRNSVCHSQRRNQNALLLLQEEKLRARQKPDRFQGPDTCPHAPLIPGQ